MQEDDNIRVNKIIDIARRKIAERRKQLKLSLRQLGDLAEVDPNTINDFEAGRRIIRLEPLIRIALALQIDISDLWTDTPKGS